MTRFEILVHVNDIDSEFEFEFIRFSESIRFLLLHTSCHIFNLNSLRLGTMRSAQAVREAHATEDMTATLSNR